MENNETKPMTAEEMADHDAKLKANKDYLAEVKTSKATVVNDRTVEMGLVVESLRVPGNQLTSQVSKRTVDDRIVLNTVTSTVQEVDEVFLMNDRRFRLEMEKTQRKRTYKDLKPTQPGVYNTFYNYYASQTKPGLGLPLQDVINRFNAGVPTTDNNDKMSWDSDLPFIDETNWMRLGGLKYSDISQVETPYQKAFTENTPSD